MIHLENDFCILLETKEDKILRVDKILLTVTEISKKDFNILRNLK